MLTGHLFKYWTYQLFAPGKVLRDKYAAFKSLLDHDKPYDIYNYCRRPLVIRDTSKTIGEVISYLKSIPGSSESEDGAIEYDAVLIWGPDPRIITGADILGKLLKGISAQAPDAHRP